MKVIAREQGYFEHRRRPGEIFEMPETAMKKDHDGKPIPPKWVEPFLAGDTEEFLREYVAAEQLGAEAHFMGGAIAASAPAAKEKLRQQFKKWFGVPTREERAVRAAIAASGEGVTGKGKMAAKLEQFGEATRRLHIGKPLRVSTPSAAPKPAGSTVKGEAK